MAGYFGLSVKEIGGVLNTALTGVTTGTYYINTPCTLSGTLVIASGVTIIMGPEGYISTIGSVTFAGVFVCTDKKQHFNPAGTISFSASSCAEVYPEWWGTGTLAIQKAAAAHPVIRLTPAVTYISDKITITSSYTHIIATGAIIVANTSGASNNHLIQCTTKNYVKITGGYWDGNKAGLSSACSVFYFSSCSNLYLDNCSVYNGYGNDEADANITGTTVQGNITILNSYDSTIKLQACNTSRRSGLVINGSYRVKVIGGTFTGNAYNGIAVYNSPYTTIQGVTAYSNGTGGSTDYHNISLCSEYNILDSNVCYTPIGGSNINVGRLTLSQASADYSVVSNNVCTSGYTSNIQIIGGFVVTQQFINISNNICKSAGTYGIYLNENAIECTVIGNISIANTLDGIYNNSINAIISNNKISNNGRYGYFSNYSHTYFLNGTLSSNIIVSNIVSNIQQGYKGRNIIENYITSDTTTSTLTGSESGTIKTVTFPSLTLGKRSGFKISAFGDKTGSGGNKTITLVVEGSTIFTYGPANDTSNWAFDVTIYNNGTTTAQQMQYVLYTGASTLEQGSSALALITEQTLVDDITINLNGALVNTADSIIVNSFQVEYLPEIQQ